VKLASEAKANLTSHAAPSVSADASGYTGIHVHVDHDGASWLNSQGLGKEFCRSINWVLYHQAAYLAGLDNTTTLYVASAHSLAQMNDEVIGRAFFQRFSGAVYMKGNITASLATPHAQQYQLLAPSSRNTTTHATAPRLLGVDLLAAVVDFLVLAEAQVAMGHPYSSLSWFLKGYRALMLDLPPESFHMIDKQGMLFDVTSLAEQGKNDARELHCISLLP
jgi:hypothetical protein